MAELDDCTNLKQRVEHIIATEIAPQLLMDGGGLEVVSIQDGVVQVRLLGTCSGCPGTSHALLMGIEEELRRGVPEVEYLEAVP